MIRTFFALVMALGVCLPAHGQTQGCPEKFALVKDTFLQTAITGLQEKYTDFSLDTRDEWFPCGHLKYATKSLARTLRRDYLSNHAQRYETAMFLRKGGYFSIERFVFKNKKALQRMEFALKQREYNSLAVKSLTRYDYFVFENSIVFLITDASGWEENARLFKEIEQNFIAAASAVR